MEYKNLLLEKDTEQEESLKFDKQKDNNDKQQIKYDGLSKWNKWAYGMGHVLNDLCAACWFNYLSIYLKNINPIVTGAGAGRAAGLVLLSGQIADGLATPLVGYLSDKTNTKIGQRKPWYIFGAITVALCFVFIFQKCTLCSQSSSDGFRIFYYSFFASLFNVGWAALQISHMALVPQITVSKFKRDDLNSLRNTFTYLSNLGVLLIAALLFVTIHDSILDFCILSFIVIGIGLIFSIFFIININEVKLTKQALACQKSIQKYLQSKFFNQQNNDPVNDNNNIENNDNNIKQRIMSLRYKQGSNGSLVASMIQSGEDKNEDQKWMDWFKKVEFYQYGLCYMGVRISNNIVMTLVMFYARYVVEISQQDISVQIPFELALLPLIMYIFSVLGSSSINFIVRKTQSRKKGYAIGGIMVVLSSIALLFLNHQYQYCLYFLLAISGFGQAICLNTGINMISEVIGVSGSSGAFVFGMYSLLDKFSSGIIIYFVLGTPQMESNDPNFIKYSISIIPAVSCLLSWFMMILGKEVEKNDYQELENNNQLNSQNFDDDLLFQQIMQEFAGKIQ